MGSRAASQRPGNSRRACAARQAFEAGASTLELAARPDFKPLPDWAPALSHAIDQLDTPVHGARRAVVEAMAAVIRHDGRVEQPEDDLLRTACAELYCPLPLLASAQKDRFGSSSGGDQQLLAQG